MTYMFASDIHGSAYYCGRMLELFAESGAARLILLGDLLYHGPRNDLPREYAPKEVIRMLNGVKDKICAVRGNCDTEVDQMVLEFPIMADYGLLELGGRTFYATHGHIFNKDHLPPVQRGEVLIYGHTHVPMIEERGGIWAVNPGSVSIPKEGSAHSCGLLKDGVFRILDFNGGTVKEAALQAAACRETCDYKEDGEKD